MSVSALIAKLTESIIKILVFLNNHEEVVKTLAEIIIHLL